MSGGLGWSDVRGGVRCFVWGHGGERYSIMASMIRGLCWNRWVIDQISNW